MINPFKKYPYIVVEGPIGSGKSTLSRMLSENFGAKFIKEKAEQNPFLPKFYKNMSQYALPTQLFFLFQRAEQINEVKQQAEQLKLWQPIPTFPLIQFTNKSIIPNQNLVEG